MKRGLLLLTICFLVLIVPVMGFHENYINLEVDPIYSTETSELVTISIIEQGPHEHEGERFYIYVVEENEAQGMTDSEIFNSYEPVHVCLVDSCTGSTAHRKTYSEGVYNVYARNEDETTYRGYYFSIGPTDRMACEDDGYDWHDSLGSHPSTAGEACCGDQPDDHGKIFSIGVNHDYCDTDDDTWHTLTAQDCGVDFLANYNMDISDFPASYCDIGEVLFYNGKEYVSDGSNWYESVGSCGGTQGQLFISGNAFLDAMPFSDLNCQTDDDGDGFYTETTCSLPLDCNDNDATVNPDGAEDGQIANTCSDGKDNDCDGEIDTDAECTTPADPGTCTATNGIIQGATCNIGFKAIPSSDGNSCTCEPINPQNPPPPSADQTGLRLPTSHNYWAECSTSHFNTEVPSGENLHGGYNFNPDQIAASEVLLCLGAISPQYYYCVESDSTTTPFVGWVSDLDDPDYQDACANYGHKFVGSYCCGEADDPGESFNAPGSGGACMDSTYFVNGEFPYENSWEKRWVIVQDGEFWHCGQYGNPSVDPAYNDVQPDTRKHKPNQGTNGPATSSDPDLITDKDYCTSAVAVDGTQYYCSPSNIWQPKGSADVSTKTYDPDGSPHCCAANQCHDGSSCVDEGTSTTYGGETITCIMGSNGASWDLDLDDSQTECEAAGFDWTGSYCCSDPDDIDESYIDPTPSGEYMGCFYKEPQRNDGFLVWSSGSTSSQVYIENNEFHGCNIGSTEFSTVMNHPNPGGDGISSGQLITAYDSCDQLSGPDLYCTLGGDWEAANGQSLDQKQSPTSSSLGCCQPNQCWDGSACVGAGSQKDVGGNRYSCTEQSGVASWNGLTSKPSPDGTESGYCNSASQCFLEHNSGNDVCIDNGDWSDDDYCDSGAWTTRTRLVADKLIDTANKNSEYGNGNDYEILCDEKPFALRDANFSGTSISNFCVLSSNGGNVVLGAAIGSEDGSDTEVNVFLSELADAYNAAYNTSVSAGDCSGTSNFQECVDLPYLKVYYDNSRGLVLMTDENGLVQANFADKMWAIWTSIKSLFTGASSIQEIEDFDRLYIGKKSTKSIVSVQERVYDSSGNYDEYLSFSHTGVGVSQAEILSLANPESYEVETDDADRVVIFMKNPELDKWPLLGARIDLN